MTDSAGTDITAAGSGANAAGWKSPGIARAFWALAALGAPIMFVAWMLLNLASLEEATEQGKAIVAGTTMAGTTLMFGVVPLIVAHLLGLALLGVIALGGRGSRRSGILYAIGGVVAASVIGLAVALILTGGQLYVPVPE
jgi:hypothetical protein